MSTAEPHRILVVDDDPNIVFLLTSLLEEKGYHVLTAANGEIALDCAITDSPDLILLDINLPHLDGMKVCAKLRKNPVTRQIPVIFLTGNNSSDRLEQAIDVGANDFLGKPISSVELFVRIQAMLQTRHISDTAERMTEYIEMMKRLRPQLEHR